MERRVYRQSDIGFQSPEKYFRNFRIDNHQDKVLHSEDSIRQTLSDFTEIQTIELAETNPQPFKSENAAELFNSFMKTERFEGIIEMAKYEFTKARTDKECEEYKSNFVGKFYQDFTYCIMAAKEYPNRIVLSPELTVDLFSILYPRLHVTDHPFGMQSIEGISVPDGLIIEGDIKDPKITGFLESTVISYWSERYGKKYIAYGQSITNLSDRYPNIFSYDINIIFAIPSPISPGGYKILPSVGEYENVDLQLLNFNHLDFGKFVNSINPMNNRVKK